MDEVDDNEETYARVTLEVTPDGDETYSHVDIIADKLTLNGEPIGNGDYDSETWTFFYSDGTTLDKEVLTKIVEEEPEEEPEEPEEPEPEEPDPEEEPGE